MQMNVREVSKLLKVSERRVYQWIKRGVLRAERVNDQYRLHRSDLLERTCSREIDVPAEIFEDSVAAGVQPRLADVLRVGGVFHGVSGQDKRAAMRSIVERLPLPPTTDRGALSRLLLAREALGSTAIGDGIAIPHVRRPILLGAPGPSISLYFLENPIDFGAADRKPVFAIFLLIGTTVRVHLRLLSRLSLALHDPQLRDALNRQAAPDEVFAEFERVEAKLEPNGQTTIWKNA